MPDEGDDSLIDRLRSARVAVGINTFITRNGDLVPVYRVIDEAIAALEWQPIATAPKDDGRDVLIGWFAFQCEPSMHVAFWHGDLQAWCQSHSAFTNDHNWQPSHWMPLPDPPKVQDGA